MEHAVKIHQPRYADAEPEHGEPGCVGLAPHETRGADRPLQHDLGSQQPVAAHDRLPEADGAREVDDATRHVVNVDLHAEPGRPLRVQTEWAARSPNETPFRVALDDEPGVHQRIDQCRDRRLGEAGARG